LIVPVPAAAAVVDEWRERTCGARPSAGVPPHGWLIEEAEPDGRRWRVRAEIAFGGDAPS